MGAVDVWGPFTVTSRPLDSEPLPWLAIMSPYTTPSRPGTRHSVFTMENKGMGRDGHKCKRKTHSTEKSRQPLTHWAEWALRLVPRVLRACAELCCRWPQWACRLRKFPFSKRLLPFLEHWNIFDLFIESVSIKKKEDRNPGSNPDLFYPIVLSPLPLHYHTYQPKFRKSYLHKLANCLS